MLITEKQKKQKKLTTMYDIMEYYTADHFEMIDLFDCIFDVTLHEQDR